MIVSSSKTTVSKFNMMNKSLAQLSACLLQLLFLGSCDKSIAQAPDKQKWLNASDYMIQDVCLDASSKIVLNVSPLQRSKDCLKSRNLNVNEQLTYHKHDWPNFGSEKAHPLGYQRSNSFPANSVVFGKVAVQTFDFGAATRKFDSFDAGDGGQIVAFSDGSASIILTQDGGAGLQIMFNDSCSDNVIDSRSLRDTWIIGNKSLETESAGNLIAKLRISTNFNCPTGYDFSYTEWEFRDVSYRVNLAGDRSNPIRTLVSSHYGSKSVATADHMENFYFTKQLGWTRWERWVNLDLSKQPLEDSVRASNFENTKRCARNETKLTSRWALVDCREWTNIQPVAANESLPLDFWIRELNKVDKIRQGVQIVTP